jgi:hypothetical protein
MTGKPETTSTSRSEESEATWEANWRLLRDLFPNWSPTDAEARDVWWPAFSRPHGTEGSTTIDHHALRYAITEVKRTTLHNVPHFAEVSNEYRSERGRRLRRLHAERQITAGMVSSHEQDLRQAEREHLNRLAFVSEWPAARLKAAQDLVASRMDTFRGKSSNVDTWSRLYLGLVVAADDELNP